MINMMLIAGGPSALLTLSFVALGRSSKVSFSRIQFSSPHAVRGPEGLRAESEGLLLADGAPTVGWGKIFWRVGRFYLTKPVVIQKRKMDPKMPN